MAAPEIVVVTGAASGIGRALAIAYARRGAKVAALDLNLPALERLRAEAPPETGGRGHAVRVYQVDVSQEGSLQAAAHRVAEDLGKPTVWINNAGIAVVGAFEKISPADFRRVMAVNFEGVVHGTRAALSVMREPERGTIANVSSANGTVPAPFMTAYVASKHAVDGFTRALRIEKAQAHSALRVVLVAPGFVKTPIMEVEGAHAPPKWLEWFTGTPEQAAEEIIRGIDRGDDEIRPMLHGRLLMGMHWLTPRSTAAASRLLTAKNWKELLGLDPIKR